MSRLLAIDYGSKRIGLAISDPGGRVAVPLETFARTDDRGAARYIARIVAREGVGGLVLGEPQRLDGGRGEAALRVARFARRLEAATGLPVELVDESLTSVEAERRLREAGVDADAAAGRVDAVAAQILLEEVLARRRRSGT
ncbi:MAG TPA: Holliday junction resolvase RuvX [Thermoanaerobaculia bacterium]|nr:Holliday junction resolvase RuvX [Thermoanaerobaculia bacterium]